MTRRTHIAVLAAAAVGSATAADKDRSMFQAILEASLNEKKGIQLYLKGQAVAGVVTKINADSVEMRSREYSRIVVRLEAIDAAALS